MNVLVRPELPEDAAAVHEVHRRAFPTAGEADLVDALRAAGKAHVSLVALVDSLVVGHILFSPITVDGVGLGLGLAPVAVLPAHQGKGIGSRLIEEGLAVCRREGVPLVVVLGEPGFYAQFGFRRAGEHGLGNEYGADEPFRVMELRPGSIPPAGGLVRYAPEFGGLTD
jgi:putative acetyltransferase